MRTRVWHDFFQHLTRDGDAGGAAGAGAGGDAAAAGDKGAAGLAAAAAAAAAASSDPAKGAAADPAAAPAAGQSTYYPEGLPDHFKGASERETIDRLAQAVKGQPRPPASAADYKLELTPDMQAKFGDLSKDPALAIWRDVAHELRLPQDAFNGAFAKLYEKLDKAGLIDRGPDFAKEMEALAPKSGDPKEKAVAVHQRIEAAFNGIKALETRGFLTKDQSAMLSALGETASGIQTLEAIMKMAGGTGLVNGGAPSAPYTREDLKRDTLDPRYSTTSPQHDPKFRREVDEKAKTLPRAKIGPDGRVSV